MMMQRTASSIKKVAAEDLEVGLICADRDGNRIRIDSLDRDKTDREKIDRDKTERGSVSYHFLNDELRVQEGVQERTIEQFLAEGWVMAAPGTSL
jgi:hypothetical protein